MAAFSFGNATPSTGTVGFGLTNPQTGSFGGATTSQAPNTASVEVPPLERLFPGQSIYQRTEEAIQNPILLPEVLRIHKASLVELNKAQTLPIAPNNALRQQLQQNPIVLLDGNVEARLHREMLKDVCDIADDLRISEIMALSLYQKACQFPSPFRSALFDKLIGESVRRESSVSWMARELYFDQRPSLLLACRALLHDQLRETAYRIDWLTDWIPALIDVIRGGTKTIQELLNASQNNKSLWQVKFPLAFARWERMLAAECLFFIAYQTNIGENAIEILKVLVELSNALPLLDPFHHVPRTRTESSSSKDKDAWHKEWIDSALGTGLPDRLRLCSVLTVTLLAVSMKCIR